MSDHLARSLERSALSGSPSDQARALTARLRVAPGCETCGGTGRGPKPTGLPVTAAWTIQNEGKLKHHKRCSSVPGWHPLSGPGLLCDCGAVQKEYTRRAEPLPCPSCAGTGSPLRARIELAAYAGNEGARLALTPFPDARDVEGGRPTACNPCMAGDRRNYTFDSPGSWHCLRHATEHPDLAMWLSGLSRWSGLDPGCSVNDVLSCMCSRGTKSCKSAHGPSGGWLMVRAAVAAARVALHGCKRCKGRGWNPGPGPQTVGMENRVPCRLCAAPCRAIEAAEAWLERPCEEHRITAVRALLAANPVSGGLERGWLPTVPTRGALGTGAGWGEETVGVWPSSADANEWNTRAAGLAARLSGESPVRAAICSSLVEWALGAETGVG